MKCVSHKTLAQLEKYLTNGIEYKEISIRMNKSIYSLTNLKRRHLKHLGNLKRKQTIHGDARYDHHKKRAKLYNIWSMMKQRCYNEKNNGYRYYGSRGIDICCEWHNYTNFRKWALVNGYKDGLTIDRINNDKGYCPENCQWISRGHNVAKSNKANRRLSNKDVKKLKFLHETGNYTQEKLANIFNMSQTNISSILLGKTYADMM